MKKSFIAMALGVTFVFAMASSAFAAKEVQATPVKLEDISCQVGEALAPDLSFLGEDAGTGSVSMAQTQPLLHIDGTAATAAYPGGTELGILQNKELVATCRVWVGEAELPQLQLALGESELLPLESLYPAINGKIADVSLAERGTNLLEIKGRTATAKRTGTAIVDVLLEGKRMATALVAVTAEAAEANKPAQGKRVELVFGETHSPEPAEGQAEANTPLLVAQDTSLLLVENQSYTAVGTGETTLYEVTNGSVSAMYPVRIKAKQLEQEVSVPLGGTQDVAALLSELPSSINRKDMTLAQVGTGKMLAGRDGLMLSGALPGSAEFELMYGGRLCMRMQVVVTPVTLAAISIPLGISTTIDPKTIPGNTGLAGDELSLREDKQMGDKPLLQISGMNITANRPGKGNLLVYSGAELAATLPVEVTPAPMQALKIELGTSHTLKKEELPGYAAGNSPSMEEEGAELLSIEGLKLTGKSPGKTKVKVLYGGQQAALLDVDVTLPVFQDFTMVVGETHQQAGIAKNAVLTERPGNQLVEIKGQKYTALKSGETIIEVRYGDVYAGSFVVRVVEIPVSESAEPKE